MNLLSVNTSPPKPISIGSKERQTGIFKTPVTDPVEVDNFGLKEDVQVAKKHHGGPDQALYLYSAEDYAWFSEQLGRDLAPGTFGENLTLSSFGTDPLFIGDRFRIGDVLLEVTAPRIPCATLAARVGDKGFVKRFTKAERPGAYARVLEVGHVQHGDEVSYERGDSDVTLLELFRAYYEKSLPAERLERFLAAPIAVRARNAWATELRKLNAASATA